MTRRPIAALVVAVALVTAAVLSGCSPVAPPDPMETEAADLVPVDTAELRARKAEIGIEPCVPGTASTSKLPAITLPCLGGGPDVDLSSLTGPMVVNLWFAGCEPCREEMPALQEFHESYGDRVPILGIDFEDNFPGVALDWAADAGATYPQLADRTGAIEAQDPFPVIRGAPYLGFVDEDGDIVAHKFGGISSADELVELVEEHLGVRL